ncbi:biofilm PGA synthesis lipoprotein PgaB [Fluviicoccus keumensis]|uniref:Biofilm PGA synthesis lipoprotein PgaB n=1 Tax=Fluviicoccus keumensis TaxID=1435465 RepID=A0A4V2G6A2_9GAMM|nr:poly-beta-1,6-N-acetyl-D-glucosamine N-deacetylase PgaB [Fluviicoccus keumensis]RZU47836.1 biofilm PGA synthesis lipoprotein PgaB [Fluviicoccus keumensis]
MRRLLPVILLGLTALFSLPVRADAPTAELTILSYHEIAERNDALVPEYTVTPTNFVRQMDWLKNNGYHFVSVNDLLAERAGKKPLPDKAVLITFDDGYHSVYTHAYPILKMFNAPAVVALVGGWLEKPDGKVNFDGKSIPRSDLLSWDEIREMTRSGLIEVASHSYALHEGILSNPQGNMQPAATARRWLPDQKRYEDEASYRQRVTADLKRNNDLLKQQLGRAPRIIVWPYGRYNVETTAIAEKLGMPISLTLDDGSNTLNTPLHALRRILVERSMALWDLNREIESRNANLLDDGRPGKIMHVDLDYIYDPDPAQQEKNLGRLLDRIVAMGVNTVYLQAFADPDANGAADAVYFPNRHMPMRADLFNRVSWQISTRTQVKRVYAWMPMLAWELPADNPAAADKVVTLPSDGNPDHVSMGYPRLSLFSPRVRQVIRDLYQDLARSTPLDGILFHDDVTLSDYEDASPMALRTYKEWGLPPSVKTIHDSDDLLGRWTILKINALDNFAADLIKVVREEQPDVRTARNLYAQVALNPRSEVWYSQSLENSLNNYDYTAIMAMPYMEQAADPVAFLHELVDRVSQYPNGLSKTVFELQSVNWRKDDEPIPTKELADAVRALYGWGAQNVAYYPDNLFVNNPDPSVLRPVLDSKPNLPPVSPQP